MTRSDEWPPDSHDHSLNGSALEIGRLLGRIAAGTDRNTEIALASYKELRSLPDQVASRIGSSATREEKGLTARIVKAGKRSKELTEAVVSLKELMLLMLLMASAVKVIRSPADIAVWLGLQSPPEQVYVSPH